MRTQVDQASVTTALRRSVAEIDKEVPVYRTAAFERDAGQFVRAHCTTSCSGRNFWSHELLGHPADAGDRNSPRTRRATLRRAASHYWPGDALCWHRRADRIN